MTDSNSHGEHNDARDAKGTSLPGGSPIIARMPTERNAIYYNMNHKKRGVALIFNHMTFDVHNLENRHGTDVDCNSLCDVLENLGFQVSVFQNLKRDELIGQIFDASKLDHTDNDCILITVLSHGEPGILYAKDTFYKTELLWNSFTADKCPTLAGKPKLFIIQACRGDELDRGLLLASCTQRDGRVLTTFRIPIHADFLISYSTVPGYYSWRDAITGSWFIQALSNELHYYGAERDILTLLTFVAQRVAYDFESSAPDSPIEHQQKQIPCVTTMLTRLLVFGEKKSVIGVQSRRAPTVATSGVILPTSSDEISGVDSNPVTSSFESPEVISSTVKKGDAELTLTEVREMVEKVKIYSMNQPELPENIMKSIKSINEYFKENETNKKF